VEFQQVRLPIDTLISRINSGRLALPDFQRDFVWTPSQIAELLDTVARQWPMGSLLLLNGSELFEAREIECAPKLKNNVADIYLLDGQQRVTSLFHAVTNTSKYCYYIDFNTLHDGANDLVNWMSRSAFEKNYSEVKDRAIAGIALIKDIWEASSFFEWLSHVKSNERRISFLKAREEHLSGFQSNVYQVMAIELEEGIGLEALARIFETINRTGVALNAFDLLIAKLYPSKFMLKAKWEKVLEDTPLLRHFSPNDLEIMKMVSLLIRRNFGPRNSRGVRQGDILSLKSKDIIETWDEAVFLYTKSIQKIITYGVVCKELVPSWSMILGTAGCLLWLTDKQSLEWWIDSIISETFSQSANTKIVAEFDAQMAIPTITKATIPVTAESILFKNTRSNGLLAKGFAGLMIRKQARDPISGKLLLSEGGITMKTLTSEGTLSSVKTNDTLSTLVLISDESAKSLRSGRLDDNPHWKPGLSSQGINLILGKRDQRYVSDIFEGRVE
jgi:hypothetical protein